MDIHIPGLRCADFSHWKRDETQSLNHVTQTFCLLFGRVSQKPLSHPLRLVQGMTTVVMYRCKGNSCTGGKKKKASKKGKTETSISSIVSAFLTVPWLLKD